MLKLYMKGVLLKAAPLVTLLAGWQIASYFTRPIILPSPIASLNSLAHLVIRDELQLAILTTLAVFSAGFAAAAIIGTIIGLFIGWFKRAHSALSPYVYALGASPTFVFIPIIILWFGIGVEARIVYVVFASTIPIIINVMHGVRYIESGMIELARSFGASQLQTLRHIILGGTATFLIAGLRLGLIRAFTATILSEMFFRLEGVGGLLAKYSSLFRSSEIFGLIIVIIALSQLSLVAIRLVERRLLKWKPEIS